MVRKGTLRVTSKIKMCFLCELLLPQHWTRLLIRFIVVTSRWQQCGMGRAVKDYYAIMKSHHRFWWLIHPPLPEEHRASVWRIKAAWNKIHLLNALVTYCYRNSTSRHFKLHADPCRSLLDHRSVCDWSAALFKAVWKCRYGRRFLKSTHH